MSRVNNWCHTSTSVLLSILTQRATERRFWSVRISAARLDTPQSQTILIVLLVCWLKKSLQSTIASSKRWLRHTTWLTSLTRLRIPPQENPSTLVFKSFHGLAQSPSIILKLLQWIPKVKRSTSNFTTALNRSIWNIWQSMEHQKSSTQKLDLLSKPSLMQTSLD